MLLFSRDLCARNQSRLGSASQHTRIGGRGTRPGGCLPVPLDVGAPPWPYFFDAYELPKQRQSLVAPLLREWALGPFV
jgi:hypothetical protein